MSMTEQSPMSTSSGPPPRRRRGRGVAMVVGSLLIVAGLVSAVEAFSRDTSVTEQQFTDVAALEIQGQAGDIEVIAESRTDVGVTARMSDSWFGDPDARAEMVGDTLELRSDCDGWFAFGCSAAWTVAVPADSTGPVTAVTSAGDVELTGVAGPVTADTSAGDIELRQFAGEVADLETSAGDVVVDALTAPRELRIDTSAGAIEVVVPDETYRVDADTSAGDVDVTVARDPLSQRLIDAETSAGSITIAPR